MRVYSDKWDLPDGVKGGEAIAAEVIAEERSRRQCQRLMSTRPSKPIIRIISDEESAMRRPIFERARAGDPNAVNELWARYGLRYSRS